ncbi:MAG TPA: UGSC family (seleno)protein, partial [Reyranella sp.]|nr:UGSC family (seleno)protein [Reyranella sp.]
MTAAASRHRIAADFIAAQRFLEKQGWTDGLPVIPPTEELVREMLAAGGAPGAERLGVMEPLNGIVTVEKVAANAVMAGCAPEYFSVVLATVRAVMQPQFHVGSTACTTGGAAPVVMVSGPIAAKLEINSSTACFGGNVKANATIGRALRLVMRNIGGAK